MGNSHIKYHHWKVVLAGLAFCLLHIHSAWALPTMEMLETELEGLDTAPQMTEQQRKEVRSLLESSKSFLEQAANSRQQADRFTALTTNGPATIATLRSQMKRLERQTGATLPPADTEDSRAQLEQQLIQAEASAQSLRSEVEQLDSDLTTLQERPDIIMARLGELATQQDEIENSLMNLAEDTTTDPLSRAELWLKQTHNEALIQQQKALEKELLAHQIREEKARIRLSLLELQLDQSTRRIALLQKRLSALTVDSAETTQQSLFEQQQSLQGSDQLVRKLAERNTSLSKDISDTAKKLQQAREQATAAVDRMQQLAEQYRNTEQKIEIAGLSQALGQVLQEEKRQLPNPGLVKSQSLAQRETIAEVGLRQIQHQEEKRELRDVDDFLTDYTSGREPDADTRQQLRELVLQRKELLDQAIDVEQDYLRALGELDFALRQYLTKAENYAQFLTERLLWVKSTPAIGLDSLEPTLQQLSELLDTSQPEQLRQDLSTLFLSEFVYLPPLFVLLWLAARPSLFYRQLEKQGRPLRRLRTDQYVFTLKALLVTLLFAALWPLFIWLTGYALLQVNSLSNVGDGLAKALQSTAPVLFFFSLLSKFCATQGLAVLHFRWQADAVKRLAKDLRRFQVWFIPFLFVGNFMMNYDFDTSAGTLPQLTTVLAMVLFGYCGLRLIRNRKALAAIYDDERAPTLPVLFRRFTPLLIAIVPLSLAGVILAGYLYTAATLAKHLLTSLALLVLLYLIHEMVVRWLVLTKRKITFNKAVERRDQARERRASEARGDSSGTDMNELAEEQEVDLDALSKGTRELLNTLLVISGVVGIWLIWAEVLPALGILDEVSIWEYTDTSGEASRQVPVTLFDVGFSIGILVLTILATRRVPALLEFVFLQRIQLAAGGLYAIRTLSGYIIVAAGIIMALGTLGASWSQIQWMAAALSVGIGFGLQEIVANFISGLIILFERPIRVGDVVTVGDTDGIVTKIKIRATTIRNWDQKELLVPNKEFITSRLLNWTLSDQTNRILLPVGIAYGSDVVLAMQEIEEAARTNPNVLEDPEPMVSFESFGDNALIIYLRAYINSIDIRIPTVSALHVDIYERMNKAGIVIAFPQRDVHLDTLSPLDIRLVGEQHQGRHPSDQLDPE